MDLKRLTMREIVDLGLIQEINRQLLHPRGLALEYIVENGEPVRLGGVWDFRDDPEGLAFDDRKLMAPAARAKAENFAALVCPGREAALGWIVQPIPGEE